VNSSNSSLGRRWPRVAAALVLALSLVLVIYRTARAPSRPRYIFINETGHHEHDLAFKMSLKLAEKRAGVENALVLLKSLPPGRTIEETAADLSRKWRIGAERSGRGLLFLYSEKENLFKIEVSYSLEGVLPDAICRRYEEAAQTYMLSDIPQDFISELLITMNLRAKDNAGAAAPVSALPEWLDSNFMSGGAGVRAEGYERTMSDVQAAVRRLAPAHLADYRPSPKPEVTLERYLKSLKLGLGDPRLPLLTEGSGVFRAVVPRNRDQQRRVYDFYIEAEPARLIEQSSLGLAVFRPGVPNLPIVLRRGSDGLWYVDEAKSWTYFHRFEDGTDFFPNYDDLPFIAGLKQLGHPNAGKAVYTGRVKTPTPGPYPFPLKQAVALLEDAIRESPDDAGRYAAIGELYLFEMDWLKPALKNFEKAAQLAPGRLDLRWRLFDLYLNDSQAERALATLKFLSDKLPGDKEVQWMYKFYKNEYDFKPDEFGG
jgi:tetratricopeptide (TPR) repeat protein